MEPLRGLPVVPGSVIVHERRGGQNQRQSEAFKRAMQQNGAPAETKVPPDEAPVRRPLQLPAAGSRKDEGTVHHVDVIA
jgi:hypothetical protein